MLFLPEVINFEFPKESNFIALHKEFVVAVLAEFFEGSKVAKAEIVFKIATFLFFSANTLSLISGAVNPNFFNFLKRNVGTCCCPLLDFFSRPFVFSRGIHFTYRKIREITEELRKTYFQKKQNN